MIKQTLLFTVLSITPAISAEMVYGFKNPAFSGDGWSSHTLTIENQEFARKKAIEADRKAKEDADKAAATNTNLNKFLNNLESRIYAQLSLQLSNAMFADGSTTGTLDFQGSTISWVKDSTAGTISLSIIDTNGNRTDIVVPTGSFKF
jgi:Type VIII secretion system (T8SS), CsgF protein